MKIGIRPDNEIEIAKFANYNIIEDKGSLLCDRYPVRIKKDESH